MAELLNALNTRPVFHNLIRTDSAQDDKKLTGGNFASSDGGSAPNEWDQNTGTNLANSYLMLVIASQREKQEVNYLWATECEVSIVQIVSVVAEPSG